MPTITIGGVNVQYEAFPDLGNAVESQIGKLESRLKKVDHERRTLQRERRALKSFLGGKARKQSAAGQKVPTGV